LEEIEIYQQFKECGFDYAGYDFIAANARNGWQSDNWQAWASDFRKKMDEIGVTPVIAHVTRVNPFDGEEAVRQVERAVQCASRMGIEQLVVPLGMTANNTRRQYETGNQGYLRRVLRAAEDENMTLLIEHAGGWHMPNYMHYAMELNRMMEKLGMPEKLKVNLSIANMGMTDMNPYPDIRVLGSAIQNVDASDNFGSMALAVAPERENLGFAPLMGYIDYDQVMQGLCDVGYSGFFNLRLNMPRVFEKPSKDAPLAIMPQHLTKRLLAWSRRVTESVLKAYDCLDQ